MASKRTRRRARRKPRRRRRRKSPTVVNLMPGPRNRTLPPMALAKFRYVTEGNIDDALPYNTYQFRMNGLFDSDFSSTGHQPSGFDALMALYKRYRVYKVEAKATFITSSSYPQRVALYGRRDASTYSNPLLHDLSNDKTTKLSTLTDSSGSKTITTLRKTFYPATFYKGEDYMKDLDFTGTSTNVPARQGYINLGVYNLDKTNRVDCDFEIELIYHARLERIDEIEPVLED